MRSISSPWGRSRARAMLRCAALAALLAAAALSLEPGRAQAQVLSFEEQKAVFEAYFAQVPDVTVKGSGFKPYQRWIWFYGPRVDANGFVPGGARWNAWEETQQLREGLRGQPVWTNLGPVNIAGRCQPIAFDPLDHDRILVGSASGGLWESTNAGASWEPVDDALPTLAVGAILFDETNPATVYVGTGEGNFNGDAIFGVGVLRSTDRGLTWNPYGTGLDWSIGDGKAVQKLAQNPSSGTLLASTTAGVYRLDPATETWTQTLAGTGIDLVRRPGTNNTFYATLGRTGGHATNGFYSSTDDGLTWQKQTTGWPTSHGRAAIAICQSQPQVLYAGISGTNAALLGIYKSIDGGVSWNLVYNGQNHYGGQGWYDLVIAVDPNNPNKVYSGGIDIWSSTDGGVTFAQRTHWEYTPGHPRYVHADQHGWAFHPDDPNHVYAACDGGVFQSVDGGVNWQEISTGLTTMQFYDIAVAPSDMATAVGGTQDNGSNVYSGSDDWTRGLGGDGFHCNIDYAMPDTMYMEYYYGNHYRSYNRGANMTRIMTGISEDGAWDTPVHLDYADTRILYTMHRKLYKTTNRGGQWVAKTATMPGVGITIAQSPSDVNVLYYGLNTLRTIYLSTDRGETWNQVGAAGLPTRAITRLKVHPSEPGTVFATYSGFANNNVYKSTDYGANWTSIGGSLPALPCNAIEIDPDDPEILYVGTDLGVWRTEDGGGSWLPYGNGLPNVVIGDLKVVESTRTLRAGTYGRGLWEVPMAEAGTSSVLESDLASKSLQILDVFPNPLQTGGLTSVRFALPSSGRVRVQLFDVTGRLIETPVDETMEAGTHRVEWSSRAPSGMYFVRVRLGLDVASGKLSIQR
ncbi:MAG: T9SS type A sorting domain-containing protein [Candidatus Eisenbacteria bacterium]|nr:T9SS type A sorting domain-containing protein [Candidatus Eisenbacteria bacterium]